MLSVIWLQSKSFGVEVPSINHGFSRGCMRELVPDDIFKNNKVGDNQSRVNQN